MTHLISSSIFWDQNHHLAAGFCQPVSLRHPVFTKDMRSGWLGKLTVAFFVPWVKDLPKTLGVSFQMGQKKRGKIWVKKGGGNLNRGFWGGCFLRTQGDEISACFEEICDFWCLSGKLKRIWNCEWLLEITEKSNEEMTWPLQKVCTLTTQLLASDENWCLRILVCFSWSVEMDSINKWISTILEEHRHV